MSRNTLEMPGLFVRFACGGPEGFMCFPRLEPRAPVPLNSQSRRLKSQRGPQPQTPGPHHRARAEIPELLIVIVTVISVAIGVMVEGIAEPNTLNLKPLNANPKLSEAGAVEHAEIWQARQLWSPKPSGGRQSSQSNRQLWAAR